MTTYRSKFVFSYEGEEHPGCDTDDKGIHAMQEYAAKRSKEGVTHFSDMDLYLRLCDQPGCVSVGVSQIHLRGLVAGYVQVQVVYRSMFSDGRVEMTEGPLYGNRRGRVSQVIDLQEKEWITYFRLHYSRYIGIGNPDQIFYTTSKGRSDTLGGGPGFAGWWNGIKYFVPKGGHYKLVALAVSTTGSSGDLRIGCFCESYRWEIVKEWVLCRSLIKKKRASVLPTTEEWIKNLMSDQFDEDIFRRILGFWPQYICADTESESDESESEQCSKKRKRV